MQWLFELERSVADPISSHLPTADVYHNDQQSTIHYPLLCLFKPFQSVVIRRCFCFGGFGLEGGRIAGGDGGGGVLLRGGCDDLDAVGSSGEQLFWEIRVQQDGDTGKDGGKDEVLDGIGHIVAEDIIKVSPGDELSGGQQGEDILVRVKQGDNRVEKQKQRQDIKSQGGGGWFVFKAHGGPP